MKDEANKLFRLIVKRGFVTTKTFRFFSSSITASMHLLKHLVDEDMVTLSAPESVKKSVVVTPARMDKIH